MRYGKATTTKRGRASTNAAGKPGRFATYDLHVTAYHPNGLQHHYRGLLSSRNIVRIMNGMNCGSRRAAVVGYSIYLAIL